MTTNTETKSKISVSMLVLAFLGIVGIAAWMMQLSQGLQVTGLNNHTVWGLYIVGFMIATGIAAAALIFSSSAYLFKSMEEFKPFARLSVFIGAICSVVAAGFFIIVDIGNPERAWNIITSAHFQSPLLWDTLILASYAIIGILFTRMLMQVEEGKKDESNLKSISIVAFVAGLLVTATSFVFAMWVARPLWNTPVQPLSFLAAALVAGLALLVIAFSLLNKKGYISISDSHLIRMGSFVGVFLLVEFLVVLSEAAIGLYNGAGEEAIIMQWLVLGEGAPFFWAELAVIVLGLVLLFSHKTALVVWGSGVAIGAVFMIKYNLLQAQLLNPLISYAGPPGYGAGSGVYLPTLVELGVTVGIIAIGSLLVMIGTKHLPLGQLKDA